MQYNCPSLESCKQVWAALVRESFYACISLGRRKILWWGKEAQWYAATVP